MGQTPPKYFLPQAPFGNSQAANTVNPVQPAAQNPQQPLLPASFGQQTPQNQQSSTLNPFYGLFALLILLFAVSAQATTTVSGTIQTLGTTNVTSAAFVRFWLRGCGGNQPRVNGTSVIGPTQGGVFYFDLTANSSGVISGTLYSTRDSTGLLGGDIECGGVKTSVWYGMQVFQSGKGGPEIPVHAKNGVTLDITQVTPITTNPVVISPTGDGTYLRLDAGNGPVIGNLGINGTLVVTGNTTAAALNSLIFVDGVTHTTIQSAVNAAALLSPTGFVVIPATYSGSDTYTNSSCVGGLDLRGGGLKFLSPAGGCGQFTQISLSPTPQFPLGGDLNLTAGGPADLYIQHTNTEATTTTASLTGGMANNNVLVGSTTLLSPSTGGGTLLIGRGTSTEESVPADKWTIVNGTHINVTPANSHSGTTDIEQLGNTSLYTGDGIQFSTNQPASLSGHSLPARLKDANPAAGNIIMQWPGVYTDAFPYSAFQFSQPLTGTAVNCATAACPAKLSFRNSDSTHGTQILTSNNLNICDFEDANLICSAAMAFENGNTLTGFSDAGSTQTYKLNGATGLITANGGFIGPTYDTYTNCGAIGSAANPSLVACGSAAAGAFSCDIAASTGTCVVSTTAVTANSEIIVQQVVDEGTRLGVTCNTASVLPSTPLLLSKLAGVSFTITLGTELTNPGCFDYTIVN